MIRLGSRPSWLVEREHEDLAHHLFEVLLDDAEVLTANLVHEGKFFEDFRLALESFLFSDLEVGNDFLLRHQDALKLVRRSYLVLLLELLRGAQGGRASQVEVIVAAKGNSK